MPKYEVKVEWSGYSKGYSTYKVEADSKDVAEYELDETKLSERVTVRNDMQTDYIEVKLIK